MSNYPAGAANDPRAPYNQRTNDSRLFDVTVEVVMSRRDTVRTSDYVDEYDEYEQEVYTSTAETDWEAAYEDSCYTLPELLEELRGYLKQDLEQAAGTWRERVLKAKIAACEGRKVEELNVEKR